MSTVNCSKRQSKQPNWGGLLGQFLSYGLTTLLLAFFNDSTESGSTDNQQPSKFTEDNTNQIGSCIPVVLGRALIKDPLVSYYGSFRADPYTEEYGMHTDVDIGDYLIVCLITNLAYAFMPKIHPVVSACPGEAIDSENGIVNALMMTAVQVFLWWLLQELFGNNGGKTTIQKGFKYYLGWQHILCWTADNIGLRRIWMNVYNTESEASREQGVWTPIGESEDSGELQAAIAYKVDNQMGITCRIEDDEMFGGPDEGGGFIGDVRVYFGTDVQNRDAWMVKEMSESTQIDDSLKGLTPKYPWFVTAVISDKDLQNGAYIGKQATVPEMWFELVNYPNDLSDEQRTWADDYYYERLVTDYENLRDFIYGRVKEAQDRATEYSETTMKPVDYFDEIKLELQKALIDRYNIQVGRAEGDENEKKEIYEGLLSELREKLPEELKPYYDEYVKTLYYDINYGRYKLEKIGEDLNPARVIVELLFNPLWGAEYKEHEVDMRSIIKVACRLEREQIGISCLINNTAQVKEYLRKILEHIGGVMFDDPTTGKLTFSLIRNDFNLNRIKHFTVDNCSNMEFSRMDWGETVDTVKVLYTNPEDNYSQNEMLVNDISNRLITGRRVERAVDGTWFTTDDCARWFASMQLKSLAYPLCSIRFECNRYGYDVKVGDPIRVTWEPYGIATQVFRVTDVDYGYILDGKITISALEDVFSFGRTDYTYVTPVKWRDEEKEPWAIARYMYIEKPYEMHYSLNTFVDVVVSRPHVLTDHYDVWRWDGAEFKVTSRNIKWGIVGRSLYGYEEGYEDDEEGFSFYVVGEGTEGLVREKIDRINADPDSYHRRSGQNLVFVDEEIISYESIEEEGTQIIGVIDPKEYTIFRLKGIVRGVYDTVPQKHTTESEFYFWDIHSSVNAGKKVCSAGKTSVEEIELRSGTSTTDQEFNGSEVDIFTTQRRAEAPSPMGNLKLAADRGELSNFQYNVPATVQYSGDLLFHFICRNKFQDTSIISQPEYPGVWSLPNNQQNAVTISIDGADDYEWKEPASESDGTMLEEFRLPWYVICTNFFSNLSKWTYITYRIRTYNPDKDLYSYGTYKKLLYVRTPYFAGAADNETDLIAWATQITNMNDYVIPETSYNPRIVVDHDVCVFVCLGTKVPYSPLVPSIMAQDGSYYVPEKFFRLDGLDSEGELKYHEITSTVKNNWVFTHNFNTMVGNEELAIDYDNGQYTPFIFVS